MSNEYKLSVFLDVAYLRLQVSLYGCPSFSFIRIVHELVLRFSLDYSRVEANPPHPNNKVEEAAHEAVDV